MSSTLTHGKVCSLAHAFRCLIIRNLRTAFSLLRAAWNHFPAQSRLFTSSGVTRANTVSPPHSVSRRGKRDRELVKRIPKVCHLMWNSCVALPPLLSDFHHMEEASFQHFHSDHMEEASCQHFHSDQLLPTLQTLHLCIPAVHPLKTSSPFSLSQRAHTSHHNPSPFHQLCTSIPPTPPRSFSHTNRNLRIKHCLRKVNTSSKLLLVFTSSSSSFIPFSIAIDRKSVV